MYQANNLEQLGLDVNQPITALPQDETIEDRRKWPETLATLMDISYSRLTTLGMSPEQSKCIAHALISELATYCGGRYFYLPKNDALERAVRDNDLYHDWSQRGIQPDTLAGKYKVSVTHVYRVIKEQHSLRRRQMQKDLF